MNKLVIVAFSSLLSQASATETSSTVTPVQKVIQLMEGMVAKGKEEKQAEQVQFAAYKQFCDDTTDDKSRAIKLASEKIEVLKADIQKGETTAKKLTKEVAGLEDDVATWDKEMKKATKLRKKEKADYDKLHADYSESKDALNRAIAVLKKQPKNRPQAALAQLAKVRDMSFMPESAREQFDAFLQDKDLPAGEPDAYGYESQSSGIVDMLSKLLDKFTAELTDVEQEEMRAKNAYELSMQDLKAQTDQAKGDITEKTEYKAKTLQKKADDEGEMDDTEDNRKADVAYLKDLKTTCRAKAKAFEARQGLRTEELEAINKAIEIVSGSSVKGNAETYLPKFVQTRTRALVSLRMQSRNDDAQGRVAEYLAQRSKMLESRVLAALATRASNDPFDKVKKMISDLILKLMEEANSEAEHKGWCDTELGTNEKTRTEKTEAVETLHAEIDQLEASIAKHTREVSELSKEVSDLDKAVAEATKLRESEATKNKQTIQDAQEAGAAVETATGVLKEFYDKASKATALVQQSDEPVAPEIFGDEPYTGMGAESGGVVGMLEVIASDFARLESETRTEEAEAQKEYDTFVSDSKVDKAAKETDIEHKTSAIQDQTQALTESKKDLDGTQKELDAALAYFDKLKPSCVDSNVSYEDRVARRKEEIESLQEALRILSGEDLA